VTEHTIADVASLNEYYGEVSPLAARKTLSKLDQHCRNFIAASPFLVLGTASAEGPADVSPRGDGPGFVAILDETTLLIPDRPGNRRVDSMSNIVSNPQIALIFFVPGMNETLRVNGTATITTDEQLLQPLAVRGKPPVAGILVNVEQAFLHCAKALVRSKLWAAESQIQRHTFPSLGTMLADQIAGVEATQADRDIEESLQNRLY